MCSLRDAAKDLEALGAVVVGVSADAVAAVKSFHLAQGLTFPLLADPDGTTIRAWGVQRDGSPLAQRVTFVVDPDGRVRHVETDVKPQGHGASLVETLRRMQSR
jgi:peroxiredoxin Q/BCP